MILPLRNNNQQAPNPYPDDAYNEYNQLPGQSFYPYTGNPNQFQSSMPADDYT